MGESEFFGLIEKQPEEKASTRPTPFKSTDDTFFSLVQDIEGVGAQSQVNINATSGLEPDAEARIYDLSKRSGLPVSTVRETPDGVEQALKNRQLLPESIQSYFATNRNNPAISNDDIDGLTKVQTTWDKTKQAFEEGDLDNQINILVTQRELFGADPEIINPQIEQLREKRDSFVPFEREGFIEKVMTGTARQIPQQITTIGKGLRRSAEGLVIGGAIGLAEGQPGLGIRRGAQIGFKVGSAEGIFTQEFGGAFQEFSDIRDEQGKPLDPAVVKTMAFSVGGINAMFEFLSFKKVIGTFPGGDKIFSKITPQLIKKVATNKLVRDKLKEIGLRAGTAWTVEIATELLQETTTVLFGELSKELQETLTGAEFKDFDFDVFFNRLKEIATETAYSAFGFILPGTTVSTAKTVADSVISKNFHDDNDNMKSVVDETKTQQRSADHSEQFLKSVGVTEPIYMSPEGVDMLYQDTPAEEADAILKKVGIEPNQAKERAALGEDTQIPQNKALSQLNTEEYGKISKDIKPTPGSYTRRDIEQQRDQEDVENSVKLIVEQNKKDKLVTAEINRIKEEGTKAGLEKEVVENAPILMRGLADRLSLEDVDPVDFLKKIGFERTAFEKIKGLFQAEEGARPRAAIPITNESHLISLFEGADLSSVLHEVGHVALKEYNELETTGLASESLKKDLNTIREWVGAEAGQELTRDQSEQFARGFEAYLMEGKAPTPSLRAAFERFKRWLTQVYQTAKGLDVKLDKNVRGVFDRMLSTNLEVEAAAQSGGFSVKTDAEMQDLGMGEADRVFATKLINQTTQEAERKLSQARNKGYREKIKTWRVEAEKEIRAESPVYDTMDLIIKEDKIIDRDQFIERYTKEGILFLPDKRVVKKNGLNIDTVAALYEFEDAFDMIDQFFTTPKLEEATAQRVNQKQAEHDAQWQAEDFMVDQKSYREYLDLISRFIGRQGVDRATIDAGIARNTPRWTKEATQEITQESPDLTGAERQEAIDAKVQENVARFEKKQATGAVISTESLKALARETINAKTVSEAKRVDKYLSAMKKAASDERRAILRKDWGAASRANELGRFNYEMAGLSVKIRDEVDTILKRAKRIGKSKTIDFEHKEAILSLIDRYKLASLVPQEPQKTPDFVKLFAGDSTQKTDFYNDGFSVPDFFSTNYADDFRELSMEQLRQLDDSIRYLQNQGSVDKKTFLSDGVTKLQDVVDESVEVQNKVKVLKKWERGSMMRRLSDLSRSFFARLDSLNFVAKSLDGYTNLGKKGVKGPVEQFIIDAIKNSENALTRDWIEVQGQLQPHLNQVSRTIRKWNKQFGSHIRIENAPVPELLREDGQTKGWKPQQIFAVVLNTGNIGEASNFQNLLAGYEDMNPGVVENIKNMLTVQDMDAVQGIWDAMESLFEKTDAQHLKTKNYKMSKVEATAFTFKGKEYRGGYYPIKHDRTLSYQVDDRSKVEDLFNKDDASFQTPYTKSGHTVKRLRGVALPILLDMRVVDAHFRDTLQYIHFTDAIRDADRITRNGEFRRAATRILGKQVYDTIRPSLGHIATAKKEGLDVPGARSIEWMRGLSTLYVLAWNTGVALKQPLSTFGAIRDMGAKAYAQGFASTLLSPASHYQKMLDLSPYMKNRLTAFDRELKSQFLKLTKEQRGIYFGDTKVTWQDVKNFGFWQIRVADTATVLPIWHGAFNDRLNEDQSNLDEAVRYADDIVRNSQPSAAPLDLSSWQRDAGAIRLVSQFQTFTVGKYGQRQRLFSRAWRNRSISTLDYAWFNFMDAFVPLIAINMLMGILWGRDLGDEEEQKDIMFDVLQSWAFMGVPLVSNIARSISRYGDPFDSPVVTTANKAIRGVVSGAKGLNGFKNEKEREQAMWGIAHTFSILTGVPISNIVARAERGAKQKEGAPLIKYLVPAPRKKK